MMQVLFKKLVLLAIQKNFSTTMNGFGLTLPMLVRHGVLHHLKSLLVEGLARTRELLTGTYQLYEFKFFIFGLLLIIILGASSD